jgi:prepilin-type N-terminal cleavage/methylation domain-containing protein
MHHKIESFKIHLKFKILNLKLFKEKGFSLIELMLVIAILVILATIVNGYYLNYLKNTQLDSSGKLIASTLIKARDKSMAGEIDKNWGVHFVNGTNDYYELFSSPTDYPSASTTVSESIFLDSGVSFSTPAAGASSTVIFSKISGTTTVASVVLISNFGGTSTVSISEQGRVE